ncbi:hypothetical protein MPER_15003, partial [Moniliophthora perniciosa FA553]
MGIWKNVSEPSLGTLTVTNLAKARSFVDMMNKGHPEYGCFISRAKTFTNFDYNEDIMNVTGPLDR